MVKQVSSFTIPPRAQVVTPKPSSEAQFFTPNGDRVSIDLAASENLPEVKKETPLDLFRERLANPQTDSVFSQGKRRALGDKNQERVEKTLWRHFEQQVAGGADPEAALQRVLRAEDAARNDGLEVWEGWMDRLLAPGGQASVEQRCDALQAVGRVSFAVPEKEMAAVFECQEKLLERGWNDTDIKNQLAHLADHISTALGSEGRLRHEEAPGTFVEFCQQLPQLSKSYTMGWMLDSWHDGFQPERARQLAELKGHQIEGWLQEFFPKMSQDDAETVLKSSWIHKGDSNRPNALREDTATRSILRFMASRQKVHPKPEDLGKETLKLTLHLGSTMKAEAIASVFDRLHDLPEERLTTVKNMCNGTTWPPIALELEGLAANSKMGLEYSDSVKLLDGLGLTQLGFYREPGVRSKAWNAMESAVLGGRPLEQVRREILRLAAPEQGSTGNVEFPQHIENYQALSPDLQPKYASLASLVPEPEAAMSLVQRSQQVPGFDLESAYLRPPSTQDGKATQAALEQALSWTEQGVPATLISAALSRDYLFEGRLEAKDVQGNLDAALLKACFQPEQPAERPYLESLIHLKETLKARGRASAPDPAYDIDYSMHFEKQRRSLPSSMRAGAPILAEELKAGKVPAFVFTRLAEVLEQRGSHQLLKAWPQIAAAAPGARQAFWQLEVEPYLNNPAELQQRLAAPTPPSPLLEVARQLKLDQRWEGNPEVVRAVLDSYQSSMTAGFAPAQVIERLQAQLERLESHGNSAQTAANIVRDTNSFLLTENKAAPKVSIVESEKSVSIGGISILKKKHKL